MKKLLGLVLGLSAVLAGCGKQEAPASDATQTKDSAEVQTVTMASTGSDADIWRHIASLPETKAAGIKLEVKNFTDYVAMNTAVANKEVDLNAFQSYAYLVAFNAANKDKIAPVSTTYLEPMGIYSNKVKKVEEFAQGATRKNVVFGFVRIETTVLLIISNVLIGQRCPSAPNWIETPFGALLLF